MFLHTWKEHKSNDDQKLLESLNIVHIKQKKEMHIFPNKPNLSVF